MSVNLVEYQKTIFKHIDDFQAKGDESLAVRFYAGGIYWAFDSADLLSVSQMPKRPTVIPGSPDHIRGLTQQDGDVLSIFDYGHIIHGDKTQFSKSNRVLVVHPALTVGVSLLVDKTYSLVPIESLIAASPKYTMPWSNTAYTHEDSTEVWHWINIKTLLTDPAFNTIRRA